MTDLAELRAIAEQATAGPWEASHRLDSIGRPIKNGCYVILQRGTNKREDFFIAEMPFGAVRSADKREHDANARHIVAFNPVVALAFVAVAEAAKAAFDQPHIAASSAMKPVRTALAALDGRGR